jgi:hypothetical protein
MIDRESEILIDLQPAIDTAENGGGLWLDLHPPTDWHDDRYVIPNSTVSRCSTQTEIRQAVFSYMEHIETSLVSLRFARDDSYESHGSAFSPQTPWSSTSEETGDEPNADDDEYRSREGWQVRCVPFDLLFVSLISGDQQQCQRHDSENDCHRVGTHEFEAIG